VLQGKCTRICLDREAHGGSPPESKLGHLAYALAQQVLPPGKPLMLLSSRAVPTKKVHISKRLCSASGRLPPLGS
jgi:hypothetical protein